MKTRSWLLVLGVVASGMVACTAEVGTGSDTAVEQTQQHLFGSLPTTLHRVAYTDPFYWQTTPGFGEFEYVSNALREETYIAKVWEPDPANVKYVILFSAGQQPNSTEATTTGQPDDWGHGFMDWETSEPRLLSMASMLGEIVANQENYPFDPSNTLLVAVFKGPSYTKPYNDKAYLIDAYYQWLYRKANAFSTTKLVYLAGSSRGGLLASWLGKRIRQSHATMRVLVSSIDGVANEEQSEMATYPATPVQSPLESDNDRFCMYADLTTWLNGMYLGNFAMYQTVTGHGPGATYNWGDGYLGWKGFCYGDIGTANGPDHNLLDYRGFYSQYWFGIDHGDIVSAWYGPSTDYQMRWFYRKAFDLAPSNMVAHDFTGPDTTGKSTDDLFWASGRSWFIKPGGTGSWKRLSNHTELVSELQFGDLDGDGKTDVIKAQSNGIVVSLGGTGDWELVNTTQRIKTADLAIGDFDGDGKGDIFWSPTAGSWRVMNLNAWRQGLPATAYNTVINTVAGAPLRSKLLFGNFDGVNASGKVTTDAFWTSGGVWYVSYDGKQSPVALLSNTTPLTDLAIGDLNGNGKDDVLVARSNATWYAMLDGGPSTTQLAKVKLARSNLLVGDFTGNGKADIMYHDLQETQESQARLYEGGVTTVTAAVDRLSAPRCPGNYPFCPQM